MITPPRMYKKILIPVGLILGACIGVYFTYFHRPPTEDILAANRQRREHVPNQALEGHAAARMGAHKKGGKVDEDYYYYDEEEESEDWGDGPEAASNSFNKWQAFLDKYDYVSIGDLFDRCEGEDKVTLGKVIMIPDKAEGGIMSRTFLNTTLKKEISGGEMYLECSYNGKELYKNHWELCTVEEGMDDRIIFCPISSGKHKFVKDLKIPNYLPKGRYTTKAWLTNQDEDILGCAFADFTI